MDILETVRNCRACIDLPLGPRPVVQGDVHSKILIVGQAPGLKVHQSGVPWDDASGERLRDWIGLSPKDFYDPKLVAILPIGFCYPGRAKSGDAPPRKECFDLWHHKLLEELKEVKLTLLIGTHAQTKYLKDSCYSTGTETIKNWRSYLPKYIPMPHPSPRNNIWLSKNNWFINTEMPEIRETILKVFDT